MSEEESPLERVSKAMQDFVNSIDDEAPVIIRGGVIAWESMIFDENGDAAYRVSYASLPETSMASTIGILHLATKYAEDDMTCRWRVGDDD